MVSVALLALCLLCLWSLGSADGIIVQEGSNLNDLAQTVVLVGGLPVVAGFSHGHFPGTTNAGINDAIVVKYNMDGSQAAKATFGTSSDDRMYASAIDTADNIVVVGWTAGTLTGSSAGSTDAFIAKLDSNLNQAWLVQTGTDAIDQAYAVAVDSAGKVILGGRTSGTWDAGTQSNIGLYDAFLMQYDSSGTTRQWVLQVGSSSNDYLYGIAIDKVDSVDDIYGIGYSHGNFDGLTNAGNSDIFLIKVRLEIPKEIPFVPSRLIIHGDFLPTILKKSSFVFFFSPNNEFPGNSHTPEGQQHRNKGVVSPGWWFEQRLWPSRCGRLRTECLSLGVYQ